MAPARHLYVDGRVAASGISDRGGGSRDRGGGPAPHARRAPVQRPVSAPGRIFALALVAACLVVAGCGGNDKGSPIPAATARLLAAQLDGVQARIDQGSGGACKDILEGPRGPNKQQVQDLIDSLPGSVDSDVRSALQDSFDN